MEIIINSYGTNSNSHDGTGFGSTIAVGAMIASATRTDSTINETKSTKDNESGSGSVAGIDETSFVSSSDDSSSSGD